MCATRAVYATQNNALNRQFCQQLFTLDANGQRNTMAEALRVAKVNMVTRRLDESINKLKYVYFGDPALALAIPTGGVVIDSIDGKAVVANRRTQLKAGQVVRFSGYVTKIKTKQQPPTISTAPLRPKSSTAPKPSSAKTTTVRRVVREFRRSNSPNKCAASSEAPTR